MTIRELLSWGSSELITFDSARLDAELLLSHVIGKDLSYLLAHDEAKVGFWDRWKFEKLVNKRRKGVPIAYLRGYKEFYGLEFSVNKNVLVPRPDTEALVEAMIGYITGDELILDVGTGSGCIPISVIRHIPKAEAVAVDISPHALEVASSNAHRHQVSSRMVFIESNLLENVDPELFVGWDIVVSANLPYVPKDYQVNIETQFEPQIALYGGDDGLDIYRRLILQLKDVKPKAMFFECFDFQIPALIQQLPNYKLKLTKKMPGLARVILLERQ